jgi:hypothetical protein
MGEIGVTRHDLLMVFAARGGIGAGRLPSYPNNSACSAAFLSTRSARW